MHPKEEDASVVPYSSHPLIRHPNSNIAIMIVTRRRRRRSFPFSLHLAHRMIASTKCTNT